MSEAGRRRLEELYAAHSMAVLRFALRRTRDMDEAQEVTAETFLIAWRKVSEIPEDQPLVWLYVVARNVLSNQARSRKRRENLATKVTAQPRPTVPGADELVEERAAVLEALESLKPSHQEALRLAYWEDLEPAQGAEVLGRSRMAFNALLHRARKALAKALDEGARDLQVDEHG